MKQKREESATYRLALGGMMVAVVIVCAWITIPIGVIPVTLQIFGLFVTLLALDKKTSILVVFCYVLMGAIGLPVFSGGKGSLAVIAGPTGGFIWGYLIAIVASSFFLGRKSLREESSLSKEIVACLIFLFICYLCGWLQLMFVSDVTAWQALCSAVLPFIVIDVAKGALAILVAHQARKIV